MCGHVNKTVSLIFVYIYFSQPMKLHECNLFTVVAQKIQLKQQSLLSSEQQQSQ